MTPLLKEIKKKKQTKPALTWKWKEPVPQLQIILIFFIFCKLLASAILPYLRRIQNITKPWKKFLFPFQPTVMESVT